MPVDLWVICPECGQQVTNVEILRGVTAAGDSVDTPVCRPCNCAIVAIYSWPIPGAGMGRTGLEGTKRCSLGTYKPKATSVVQSSPL